MTVLTKTAKAQVIRDAVKFATAEDKAALASALTAFADKVYEAHHGEDAVKIRALRQRGWVSYNRIFEVDGPMFSSSYNVSDRVLNRALTLSKDQPINMLKTRLTDRELGEACELLKQQAALFRKIDAVTEKTKALLASVNTYKQFAEAWPLGVLFLPPEPVKIRALVVTGTDAELNKLCGLPPVSDK